MAHDGIRSKMYAGERILGSSPPQAFTIPKPPEWMDEALCKEVDWDTFFPEGAGNHLSKEAKKVCGACDVTAACLDYALERQERHGIWGGETPRARIRLEHERGIDRSGVGPLDRSKCGTEANARRHRRLGQDPCAACTQAANVARRERDARRPA